MKKEIAFSIGDPVRLTDNVRHKEFAGRTGVVKKVVKSRGVVAVWFNNGEIYDAYPENVELIGKIMDASNDVL